MPIKLIPTQSAPELVCDLRDWNSPLSRAIRPNRTCCSWRLPAVCWLMERIEFLTDHGVRPHQVVTTVFTSTEANYLLPSPIPAAVMRRSQQNFERTIVDASSLTGHQRFELRQEIIDAGEFPSPVRHPFSRELVDKPAIWRQVSRGSTITAELGAELAGFDAAIDSYDPSIGLAPVLGVIGALGWQASLAKHLADSGIHPGNWDAIARLIAMGDPAFALSRAKCERLIEAHGAAFDAIALLSPVRDRGIGAVLTRDMHEIVFREFQPDDQAGFFRVQPGGFDLETGFAGLPHGAIAEQMRLFADLFGYMTWPTSHPIVRAGLALLHFHRVRPFAYGNAEVGRLLLSLFLQDRGIPELPLDLVLMRRSAEYRHAVQAAILGGETAGFIRVLIDVCREAIRLGQEIAIEVQAEVLRLRQAMSQMATGSVDTNHLAIALCSRLVVEDHHVIFACDADPQAAIDVTRQLARLGLIDEVEVDGKFSWAVPGIRELLCLSATIHLI